MPELALWIHTYAGGRYWERALLDVLAARANGGLEAQTYAGIVGNWNQAPRARALLEALGVEVVVEAETGWEQVTQEAMYAWALEHPGAYICYAHTKGAAGYSPVAPGQLAPLDADGLAWVRAWRRSLAYHVIENWRECVKGLDEGADAAGIHYLPEQDGGGPYPSHFQGNFWWATAAFVASLPPVAYTDRYEAEFWMGRSDAPRTVLDLCPGGFDMSIDHDSGPCVHGQEMIHDKQAAPVG